MPSARLISDPAELPALRPAWPGLWRATPGATFFHTLDWLQCYWRHFGQNQQLRVIVVEEAGQAIGILPLTIRPEPTAIGEVSILTFPLHDWGSYYGPLGPAPRETLAAAFDLLAGRSRDWELLDLRWVDPESAAGLALPAALDSAGFTSAESAWQEVYQVDLSAGWEAYFASRTSGFRNNIRRAQKRVMALGSVEVVRFRPLHGQETMPQPGSEGEEASRGAGEERQVVARSPDHAILFDQCVAIAERSWQGSSDTGTTLSHPGVRDFLREAHVAAATSCMLDLCLIRIDGRPAAFAYNYHHAGYVYGLRSGWDPEFADAGLGTFLYATALEGSCGLGDRLYDLGANYYEAKARWINRIHRTVRLRHYPLLSPRAQMLRLKHWLTDQRAEAVAT